MHNVLLFLSNFHTEKLQIPFFYFILNLRNGKPIIFLLDILWYHNSKFLKNSDNVLIVTDVEEMKTTCTLLNVTNDCVGIYVCKAINDVSEITTRAKLELASGGVSTSVGSTTKYTTSTVSEMSKESVKASTKETSKAKTEKKVKSLKKVSHAQKTSKEQSKSEVIVTQAQRAVKEAIEMNASDAEETITASAGRVHLEIIRDDGHISDASSVNITAKTERFDDEDVEIIEETEEIHVKIYKEIFSVEEMENFKVADEVNSILETIEAHQFGSGERPLREIATVAHLLKKGVEITEIIQLYDANFFPALKLPESQSALVQLVERQGHESLIAEILNAHSSDDESLLASTVGFRAFIRMVEVTKTPIEEIITNFKFDDFVSQEWKHKEIRDNEFVEVTESHVSSIRAEKVTITGNEFN